MTESRYHICIGPVYPGIGSWEWIGQQMGEELSQYNEVEFFLDSIPNCDLAVIVKYDFPRLMDSRPVGVPVIFCPVDCYGSVRDIDHDGKYLFQCSQIITHSESLRKYFNAYAPVEYLDHHVRFISETLSLKPEEGPILWTGIRSNLPPLIEWINRNPLDRELWILTNLDQGTSTISPREFDFTRNQTVRIENWEPQKHIAWAELASCAMDVKGTDFRARHKPPAKAIDSLASCLPLAMNADSSSVKHLARRGFQIASIEDQALWFSSEYRDQTLEYAAKLRKTHSRENIGKRFKSIIDRVLNEESSKQKNSLDLPPELESSDTNASKPEEPSYQPPESQAHQKIAIVSFLYNWPSTGGGNIHTMELVQFLGRAGYEVQHFCVR